MAAILSLHEAVKQFIQDGDTVALEGFTHLIPTAAGHEIIRQGKRDLTLVRMTPDLIYDQLIGAGCASKLIFSWAVTQVSVRCTACVTPWKNNGRTRSRSKSTATPTWPTPTSPAPRACPCRTACLCRFRPAQGQPADPERYLPVHRRSPGSGAFGAP